MHLASLLIFAAALFVAAGSPGPSVAALVARVISKGFRDVFPFLAAMWIGEGIWLSCAVFGLAGRLLGGGRVIPFGPYLVLGALLALFFGDALLGWYLQLLGF